MELNLVESRRGTGGVDATVVLAVEGDIDIRTAPALRDRLVELIDGGATELILDLNGVSFCDSSALGVLIGAEKRMTSMGRSLKLACAHPQLLRIMEITRLTEVFDIYDSVPAAG